MLNVASVLWAEVNYHRCKRRRLRLPHLIYIPKLSTPSPSTIVAKATYSLVITYEILLFEGLHPRSWGTRITGPRSCRLQALSPRILPLQFSGPPTFIPSITSRAECFDFPLLTIVIAIGRLQAALAALTNEVTITAAQINFDFSLVRTEAPKEYRSLGETFPRRGRMKPKPARFTSQPVDWARYSMAFARSHLV